MTTITANTSDYTLTKPETNWQELKEEINNELLMEWKMYKDMVDSYIFSRSNIQEDHPSFRGFIDYKIKGYLE